MDVLSVKVDGCDPDEGNRDHVADLQMKFKQIEEKVCCSECYWYTDCRRSAMPSCEDMYSRAEKARRPGLRRLYGEHPNN